MADFNKAHLEVMGNEGGYANNPADSGGETYKGIARKFHPAWPGWKMVDDLKRSLPVPPAYGGYGYPRTNGRQRGEPVTVSYHHWDYGKQAHISSRSE